MRVYVECYCNDCEHAWSSEEFPGICPKCGSTNISQKTIMGVHKQKSKDNMMPYIY